MNRNETELSESYELRKYEDKQALHTIVGLLEQVQANLKHYVVFLKKIIATENNKPEKQISNIRDILGDDEDFIKKQLEQIVHNMIQVEEKSQSPNLWTYSVDIAKVQDAFERLIPNYKKKSASAKKDDPKEYPSYRELDPKSILIPHEGNAKSDVKNLLCIHKDVRINLERAKKIRREIGIFTIPLRIKEYTKKLAGVGTYLDFHNQFKDELEDADDRMVVLRRLAEWNTKYIQGIVDVEKGVIYYIGNFWRQVLSYILISGPAVIGFVIILLLNNKEINLFNFSVSENSLGLYLLTFAGVSFHIIKQASYLSRTKENKGIILDKLRLWVHVREYRFFTSVLTAIAAFLLLEHYSVENNTSEYYWMFFLAGYSVDSFSDLFVQRFNTAVSTHNQEVMNKLSDIISSDNLRNSLMEKK